MVERVAAAAGVLYPSINTHFPQKQNKSIQLTRQRRHHQQQTYCSPCIPRFQQPCAWRCSCRRRCRRSERVGWFPSSSSAYAERHRTCSMSITIHHPFFVFFLFFIENSISRFVGLVIDSTISRVRAYLVPYLPVIPTSKIHISIWTKWRELTEQNHILLVRLVILAGLRLLRSRWNSAGNRRQDDSLVLVVGSLRVGVLASRASLLDSQVLCRYFFPPFITFDINEL